MIRNEHDIQHALAHLEIGAPAVEATMTGHRFGEMALNKFFGSLRAGHREALTEHESQLGAVVGEQELHDLDQYGIFGRFAGRMAVRESGLIAVESVLHHSTSPELKAALQASLVNAVGILRNS